MKKFLSLVLALVMTMSLVTVSAGAAFTDNSKVDYKEAVDVISTMGIVGGYADGSFKPEGTLTRGAAAKIICNMMLGVKTASELPSISSYKDVPAGSTFAPYIAYLKNEGVVGGYADGTFKPGNTLTGYHFLKMLLGALGYDAEVEGLQGDGWQINVAKLAKKANLYKGNDDFNGNAPATRQEACLYALNTMKAETVEYSKKDVIQIGDITIKNNSEAKKTGDCFYEADFDTLVIDATETDSQGRPAVKYTYGKDHKEIGTYGTTADHVIVADEQWDDNLASLKKALDNKKLVGFTGSNYYVNGDTAVGSVVGKIQPGDVVEVFVDDDDANKVTRLVVSQFVLAEVTKMNTTVTNKQDVEDGVEGYITVKGSGFSTLYKSTKFAGFDADYVKGTKLLICKGTSEVFASEVAESVEGKVTSTKNGKVTINGKAYKDLTTNVAIDDEGVFYLNKAGQIISSDLSAVGAAEKYIFVYNAKAEAAKVGDDGAKLDRVFTAYTVDSTGTQATYKITDAATVAHFFDASRDYALRSDTNPVIPYKIESGKLVLATASSDWTVKLGTGNELGKVNKNATAVAQVGAYYANNDTQFVFAYEKDNAMKFSTAVGYKNVGIKDDVTYYYVAKDSDIKLVFVSAKDKGAAAEETYVLGVVTDKNATVTKDGDDTLYTYDVVVDGEATTLTSKSALSLTKGTAYKFIVDGDYVKSPAALNSNTITKVASDDSYIIAGEMYEISDDVTTYTIHENYKSVGGVVSLDNYTVTADTTLEEGLKVFTFADKDDNLTIFFVKSDKKDYE